MIREHPRFQQTAIIFISAVLQTHMDFLRGYQSGAVDYVSVPVVPEILRAKVKVFAELYRKTRELERLNRELEQRVAERTAALEASAAELRRSEERLRLAFDAAQMGWWDYDIAADRVTWSPSLVRIMGFAPDTFGATLQGALQHLHPEDRDRFLDLVQKGIGGEGTHGCELRFIRADGSVRWSLASGQVVRDGNGVPTHFAGVDLDITGRKQAEERQVLLTHELDHRAKNLLAVVQSVLHLSHADTTQGFVAAVSGRIKALSHAHNLLSESRWQGVDLARIIDEELAPFAGGEVRRVVAVGPAVSLRADTAQSLALALHELATNAAKYGALSVQDGFVNLGWELTMDGLVLRWAESGGPPARPPARQGFGTKAIIGSIERQLGGSAVFDWSPDGLRCTLSIPHASIHASRAAEETAPQADDLAEPAPIPMAGRHILLVEDEAIVAMLMKEMLVDLGFTVLGPVSALGQALAAATDPRIDGAVLDVNIGGERVYPVADALAGRGIPFIFVTGYSTDTIDRRFAQVPALEKPVDPAMLRRLLSAAPEAPLQLAAG
jgi:PAS domain S-box-containing protein